MSFPSLIKCSKGNKPGCELLPVLIKELVYGERAVGVVRGDEVGHGAARYAQGAADCQERFFLKKNIFFCGRASEVSVFLTRDHDG